MAHEIGIRGQFGESSRTIPMKFFEFASRGYAAIIWVTVDATDGFNAGYLEDDAGNLNITNVKAFNMMARFLGQSYSSIKNLSSDTVGKVALTYPNGSNVEVLWPIGVSNLKIPSIKKSCIAYTHLGERLSADKKTSDAPVYIACEPANTPNPTPRPTLKATSTLVSTVTPMPTPTLVYVANVNIENNADNSSGNSSSNNNLMKIEQKKVAVEKKPAPAIIPISVPITAKTGPTGIAIVALVTAVVGSGLVYLIRKSSLR